MRTYIKLGVIRSDNLLNKLISDIENNLFLTFISTLVKLFKQENNAYEEKFRIFVHEGLYIKIEPREPLRIWSTNFRCVMMYTHNIVQHSYDTCCKIHKSVRKNCFFFSLKLLRSKSDIRLILVQYMLDNFEKFPKNKLFSRSDIP